MAPFLNSEQWLFLRSSLNHIDIKQKEINELYPTNSCGSCMTCCLQSFTSSMLDCWWVYNYIEATEMHDFMKERLKKYLSIDRHFGLGIINEKGKFTKAACPFLTPNKGCGVHPSRAMVCRSYNFIRPGSGSCEDRYNPGMSNSKAKSLANDYLNFRKEYERLFMNGRNDSLVLHPAGVYMLLCEDGEIEKQIEAGELFKENFRMLIRNDKEEYYNFIKVD